MRASLLVIVWVKKEQIFNLQLRLTRYSIDPGLCLCRALSSYFIISYSAYVFSLVFLVKCISFIIYISLIGIFIVTRSDSITNCIVMKM